MAGTQQSRDAKIDRPGDGQVRLAQWPKAILFLCVGFMFGSKSNENPISLEISYFQKLDFSQIHCVLLRPGIHVGFSFLFLKIKSPDETS